MLALARESAERSWRELRRGIDDLDALTRSAEATSGAAPTTPRRPSAAANGDRPRPYRVKP